jgi:hypothetical protein
MALSRRSLLLHSLTTASVLMLGACGGHQRPPPPVLIDVLGPDRFRLQGVELDFQGLERELTRLRDERYNHLTGTSMRRVMLRLHGSAAESGAEDVRDLCQSLGMNHVSIHRSSR